METKLEVRHRVRNCSTCNKSSLEKMKLCSKCKYAYYCSQECQKEDWPKHKEKCKLYEIYAIREKKLESGFKKGLNNPFFIYLYNIILKQDTYVYGFFVDIIDTELFINLFCQDKLDVVVTNIQPNIYDLYEYYTSEKFWKDFDIEMQITQEMKIKYKKSLDNCPDDKFRYVPVFFSTRTEYFFTYTYFPMDR